MAKKPTKGKKQQGSAEFRFSRTVENKYYISLVIMRLMKKILHRKKKQPKLQFIADVIHRLANQISEDFNARTSGTGFVFDPNRWDFARVPKRVLKDLCNEWSTPKHILHYLALNDALFDTIICNTVMKYLMPLTAKRNACTICLIKLCCCSCDTAPTVHSLTE